LTANLKVAYTRSKFPGFQAPVSSHPAKRIATQGERNTMAVYLLNLTFDQAVPASAGGLFVDNSSDATSKVWYTVAAGWPTTVPNQAAQVQQAAALSSWGTPTSDSHNLSCQLNDSIYIRLAPRNGWSSLTPLQLRFTSVFGRSPGASDSVASPFVLGNNAPCTLYATDTSASTDLQDFTPAGPDGSWIYYLGPLAQNAVGQKASGGGSNPNRNCLYSFIVGATVIDASGNWYTYGHDPGMGVKG
jgi:hypothetical protein